MIRHLLVILIAGYFDIDTKSGFITPFITRRFIGSAIGYNHRQYGKGGHRTPAVSLSQNNQSSSMRDVTIARLLVGKRHCRVLIVSNSSSDITGFEISSISYIQPSAVPA